MNLFLFPFFTVIPFLNNLTGILIKNLFKYNNILSIIVISSLLFLLLSIILFFISFFNNKNNLSFKDINWTLIGSILLVFILFITPNLIILFLFKYFKPPFVILILSILGIIISYIFNVILYNINISIKDIILILVIISCIIIISLNPAFHQDGIIKNQFIKNTFCL